MSSPHVVDQAGPRSFQKWVLSAAVVLFFLSVLFPFATGGEFRRGLVLGWVPVVLYVLLGLGLAIASLRGFHAPAFMGGILLAILGFLYFFYMPWIALPMLLVAIAGLVGSLQAPRAATPD